MLLRHFWFTILIHTTLRNGTLNIMCIVMHTQSVHGVLIAMFPVHMNYMNPCILYKIADRLGNVECKHHCEKYKETVKIFVKKLPYHLTPITDEECSSHRLVTSDIGDVDKTIQNVQSAQGTVM